MIRLDDKKVLITGGSRGIGRAAAMLFAEAGCDVAITYRNRKEAAHEVRESIQKLGRGCLAIQADLALKENIEQAVKQVFDTWKFLDILVNNAGIWTYGEMGKMDESVWAETMKVNLDSVFYACNAVVSSMKERKKGCIINVTSTAGVRGESYHSHYAASKGALHAFTKSLAVELGPYNINVNSVAPGWVDTDMSAESFSDPDFKEMIRESIPLKRIPPPEDIAGPILFLASSLARHITGEILNVNGGGVLCA